MAGRSLHGRGWHLLLVSVVLVGLALPLQPAQAATAAVTATSTLNIRDCPTLECEVVSQAKLGDRIEVTGSAVNGFLPVRHAGRDGWAYRLFLKTSSTAPWFTEGSAACAPRVGFIFNIGIGYTPSQTILDTLVAEDVAATMFPMGSFARSQPGYLRALADNGFPIGTHGDQNRYLTTASDYLVAQDTLDSIAAIEAVIGRSIDQFHTPYAADTNNRVRGIVADLGLLPVGWTIGANDYASTATEQAVYSRVMSNVYPGAVIEFHLDGPATSQSTARALPRLIRDLRAQGYDFATIPEMIEPCGATWPPSPSIEGRVVDAAGSLRCRTRPSTSAQVITTLASGSRVSVRGQTFNGWVPVVCASSDGWMSADYLALSPVNPTPTPSPTTPPATILPGAQEAIVTNTNGASLRCRALPSTSATVLASLAPNTRVPVRGPASNGWTPIRCANQDGWASSTYLSVVNSSPTSTPTVPPVTPVPQTPTPTAPPGGAEAVVANTGGASLRCRAGASTSSAIITSLAPATRVAVRGAESSGWLPIRCASQDGWASAIYLTLVSSSTPPPTSSPAPSRTGTVVNTGGATLRCRTGPGTTSALITSLSPGAVVPVRGATTSGWVPVTCAGRDGWVSADYLRITS